MYNRESKEDEPRGSISAGVEKNQEGVNLSAEAKYAVIKEKNTELGLKARYSQHFGHRGHIGRPNYGVGFEFTHRFG